MSAFVRLILVVVVSVGWPAFAAAHARLIGSVPAARSTLKAPPSRVTLTFSERLEPSYARVSVWDAGGSQIDLKDAALEPDGGKVLAVSLPPLGPGRYTVRYRVLSVDGHVVEASFVFTIGSLPRPP